MSSQPFIGIDFGTCNSSMARIDSGTGHAEVLLNAEGDYKTPSVVWFGPKEEVIVGKYAEERLESPEERRQVVIAVKRELAKPHVWMKSGRRVTPVEAAAEILKKLKQDAERGHFREPVLRAVITCPASFDEWEKDKLREAATKAGFREVELLEEPVAAAVAYAQAFKEKTGRQILVYDLGGGTFDLAFLTRVDGEDAFRPAMQPQGDRIGGEDFDRAIYDLFDELFRKQVNPPICSDGVDLHLLKQCRKWKENLSVSERSGPFSWWAPEIKKSIKVEIKRSRFEELIREYVERTIQLTRSIRDEAVAMGYGVDSVILIGGSSRIPLVAQQLQKTLHIEPLQWEKQDIAVALGAAYHANQKWGEKRSNGPKISTPIPPINDPALLDRCPRCGSSYGWNGFGCKHCNFDPSLSGPDPDPGSNNLPTLTLPTNSSADQYRRAVKWVWRAQVIGRQDLEQLFLLAQQLGLSREEAGVIEFEVMGDFKETVFDRQEEERRRGRKNCDNGPTPSPPIRRGKREQTVQADHRGRAILVLGTLSIVLGLLVPLGGIIFGIVALVIGSEDLTEMQEGRMDASGEWSTSTGLTHGLFGTCLGLVLLFVYLPRLSLWAFLASKL